MEPTLEQDMERTKTNGVLEDISAEIGYTATSLLVVEGSEFRPQDDDEALDDLVKQIKTMGRGTRYYVPRTRLR